MRDRPAVFLRIPPPVWALIAFMLAYAVQRLLHSAVLLRSDVAAAVLIFAGFGVAVWGARTFSRAGTELNPTSDANAKLVTHGPFRYTRNPMYTGVLLVSIAVALFFGTAPFYVVPVVLFLFFNGAFIPYEEAKMERQYGAQFRDYTCRVRRWGVL